MCGRWQVPQYLLDAAAHQGRGGECSIICTQPRRIAAISVADRVAAERGEAAPGAHGLVSTCAALPYLHSLYSHPLKFCFFSQAESLSPIACILHWLAAPGAHGFVCVFVHSSQ